MGLGLVFAKEFRDVRRSRMLWGLLGFSLGFMLLLMTILGVWGPDTPTGTEFLEVFASFGGQILFPILALVAGYMAVVGERLSGSIRILHGLPHSRGEILLGKFFGRASVLAAVVGVSFTAVTVLGLFLLDSLSMLEVTFVTGATILSVVTFVGIAVGISAVTASRGRSDGRRHRILRCIRSYLGAASCRDSLRCSRGVSLGWKHRRGTSLCGGSLRYTRIRTRYPSRWIHESRTFFSGL